MAFGSRRAALPSVTRVSRTPWAVVRDARSQAWRGVLAYASYPVAFVVLLLIWHGIATYLVNPVFFATPGQTFVAALALLESGRLQSDIMITMIRILTGFGIGSTVGIVVGLSMGTVTWLRRMLEPHLLFFRNIPTIALIPLAILWFGIDELPKVLLIVWTSTFFVAINTMAGVVAVPEIAFRAAKSLGASPLQVFTRVTIPSVIPFSVAGMKLSIVMGFGTIIIAEMIAANSGLGYLIVTSQFTFKTDWMFVGILSIVMIGFATDRLFRAIALALTGKYGTKL